MIYDRSLELHQALSEMPESVRGCYAPCIYRRERWYISMIIEMVWRIGYFKVVGIVRTMVSERSVELLSDDELVFVRRIIEHPYLYLLRVTYFDLKTRLSRALMHRLSVRSR